MSAFGMFTNEGDIALAEKLNEVLDTVPNGLDDDEAYAFVTEALRADSKFCAEHSEWDDTDVREAIYAWLYEPAKIKTTEAQATVSVEFHFPVEVMTLNGDARSVLDDKSDEIHEIIDDAVQDALANIEEKIGRIAGEWSGVSVQVI